MNRPAINAPHALRLLGALSLLVGCAHAQEPKPAPAPALLVAPLAGLSIPVLPITYVLADSAVQATLPSALAPRLAWADSLVGEALLGRGPEVRWMLPEALRRVARRAPGTVSDPDRMGQALLRADGLKRVPDPLFSQLRSLAAMTDARQVMVPAAVRLSRVAGGVRAEVVLVLVDARTGALLWRSSPAAVAADAGAAVTAAMARILPDFN